MNEDQVRLNDAGSFVESIEISRGARVIPDDPEATPLPIVDRGGRAWAVVWPGVGAHLRSMHRISLDGQGETIAMRHPMEASYYVMSGSVEVEDLDLQTRHTLVAGSMILVDPGTRYRLMAGSDGSEIVGGPCPPDPGVYLASDLV